MKIRIPSINSIIFSYVTHFSTTFPHKRRDWNWWHRENPWQFPLGSCIYCDCDAHTIQLTVYKYEKRERQRKKRRHFSASRILAHFNGECVASLYFHSQPVNFEMKFFSSTIFKNTLECWDVSNRSSRHLAAGDFRIHWKRCHMSKQHDCLVFFVFSLILVCLSDGESNG